jgi:citrate lyase subunit beta/citryl-CoA lyase
MQRRLNVESRRTVPPGLRSFLFAPGNHPRKVEKVFGAGADVVILDLEDAVAIAEKEATRAVVVAAMQAPRRSLGYVRVNAFETRWCMGDLQAVIGPWLDGIVLPKAEGPEQLQAVSERISECERRTGMKAGTLDLMPIVETARGIEASAAIAAAGPRVRRLAFGGGDYTNDLDLTWTPEEHELHYARARLAHGSRIAGIEPPVDTVVIQVRDTERFRRSAANGRRMGFAGKLCIHPDQVPPCNEAFTPTPAEVEQARAVIRAFEQAEAQGSASIQLDGQFIDYPIVYKAQRVLALLARVEAGTTPGGGG